MRVRAGFSLIEAQVALLLLGVGLLAVAATGVRSSRLLREAEAAQGASLMAATVLDSLAQLKRPAAGAVQHGRYQAEWTAAPHSGAIRILLVVRYATGQTVRADTFGILAGYMPERLNHAP